MVEAILKVLLEDALSLVSEALVEEHGDEEVRHPDTVVVGEGQEGVGELYLLSHCAVEEFHIQEL